MEKKIEASKKEINEKLNEEINKTYNIIKELADKAKALRRAKGKPIDKSKFRYVIDCKGWPESYTYESKRYTTVCRKVIVDAAHWGWAKLTVLYCGVLIFSMELDSDELRI